LPARRFKNAGLSAGAALNPAWREGKIPSDDAWRRVVPFREADAARARYLDRDECRRLVIASPEPLRTIVRGALLSGARYSELARIHVAEFHQASGTLMVRSSKAGKIRHIELTGEGLDFFNGIAAGRPGAEFLFHRDGAAWGKSHPLQPSPAGLSRGSMDRRDNPRNARLCGRPSGGGDDVAFHLPRVGDTGGGLKSKQLGQQLIGAPTLLLAQASIKRFDNRLPLSQ
jgi:integrase